jgi:hypothetical protein
MTQKLNQFISQVQQIGIARANRYNVIITPPQKLPSLGNLGLSNMLLFCDQVQIPGINISTIQNRTFGEFREVPYEKLFGDIQLSFYVDNNLTVKGFFDDWVNLIQNPASRTFEYYNNYISTMQIEVEDTQNRIRHRTNVYEAYPKTISAIQLDYSNKDIMKLQVTMQYKYWTTETLEVYDEPSSKPIVPTPSQTTEKNNLVPESYYNDFTNFQTKFNEQGYESLLDKIIRGA